MRKIRTAIRTAIMAVMAFVNTGALAQDADSTKTVLMNADTIISHSVVDEVVWVVGDEAILKSDVETARMQALQEGASWTGDPDCTIPEQLAVQKLFLNQADIDSIEVSESDISQQVEERLNYWIEASGSREKLEEYKKQSISQIREELREVLGDMLRVQEMRKTLVKDVNVLPAEVRRYFKDLPEDSIPFVPTEVEVQIVTQTPKIEQEEINRVKSQLRDYTNRINQGDASFSTLARLYSEDPGTARRGGELDYTGRGMLDPAFAAVAFNLTDPKKVSKIVESEFGYHIIQLIDKKGDKVKVRHILLKPQVSDEAVQQALLRLDSIRNDIMDSKFSFEDAAAVISDDKDTRNNHGLMVNSTQMGRTTSRFKMQDLPQEVARMVEGMKVGDVSTPFEMINQRGKTVCAIIRLKNRVEGHKAIISEDFQIMKDIVEEKRRNEILHQWVVDKIKTTYVRVNDQYKDCKFEYQGWIK